MEIFFINIFSFLIQINKTKHYKINLLILIQIFITFFKFKNSFIKKLHYFFHKFK